MLESPAPRVLVLGRAGDAQQQLQHALDAIGAQTLATGEIDQLDPQQMCAARPDVVLVSVDERTDDASLDRWQVLFDAPGTTVVFDDADVTRHLSGWDLARWARHLAAKVLGRTDVLPPIEADAERLPITTKAGAQPAVAQAPAARFDADPFTIDIDIHDPAFAVSPAPAEGTPAAVDEIDFATLSSQFEAEQQRASREDAHAEAAPTLDELLARDFSNPDIPGLAAATTPGSHARDAGIATPASPAVAKPDPMSLELTPLDTEHVPAAKQAASAAGAAIDLSAYALEPLASQSAASVASPVAAMAPAGVIAIVAGLGGPDAVRQVLAGLPKALPVPVLLWQHLDAGKHDRLAQQLAKASALPVYLAQPGELARPGAVAVMTASVGVNKNGEGWRFRAAEGGIAAALESALGEPGSMLMVLSGADGSVVDVAAAHAARGSEVHVQTPDSCFDAAAASALSVRGIPATPAPRLAAYATAHWPT
jgi:chemosensory pili system protein ChpB (putative protein-glutamate methylesterase)